MCDRFGQFLDIFLLFVAQAHQRASDVASHLNSKGTVVNFCRFKLKSDVVSKSFITAPLILPDNCPEKGKSNYIAKRDSPIRTPILKRLDYKVVKHLRKSSCCDAIKQEFKMSVFTKPSFIKNRDKYLLLCHFLMIVFCIIIVQMKPHLI